ncbi:hypothetical protein A3Q34_14955 [Colwellia sp. PAMC 20917]|jgi:hypothetical protein|uniref:hypothetical protein n=1 Tax=Colwellia sp. MB3u-55 TaxID=2759810 RepID=UPI00087921BA|nr:hypothetical protein [Colwellia sp. MB3u-55]AOW78027.1 hypothetical protein A3Q34_14955 [Colwellia sp. PAMC 20917]MBA6251441.1 hypothetical protein [Colwellia sp. MB3u-55]
MLLFLAVVSVVCSMFFYCQALRSGLGLKRWACAGLVFGPFIWPMFCMKKRMKMNEMFGFNTLILKA